MKNSTRNKILQAGVVAVVVVFLALALMWERNWIPFPDFLLDPVVLGAAFFVLLAATVLYKFRGKATQRDWQGLIEQDKQVHLTDKKAYELLRYELTQNRLIRIGEMHERGSDIAGPEDQDDNVRLYKMTFDRVNVGEKVGVVLDLEQDIDVDPNSKESLRKAAAEIQNIRVIRGKKVDDFDQEMEDAVSSLGRSLDQTITTTKYDEEGNVAVEKTMPAKFMQASPQLPNGDSVDEEVDE